MTKARRKQYSRNGVMDVKFLEGVSPPLCDRYLSRSSVGLTCLVFVVRCWFV